MGVDIALWQQRINDAEEEQAKLHPQWALSRKLYNMQYWREQGYNAQLTDSITPVNYTTTFVSTVTAAIFARNPKMFLRARFPRYDKFAEVMDDVLELMDDEQEAKEVYLEVLLDAILHNIGWIENGFIPSTGEQPRSETGEQTEQRGLMQKVSDLLKGKPPKTDQPPEPIATQGRLHEKQEAGQFFMIRRSPYDVLWPMGYHRYHDLPYLILHERLRMEDFMANPAYRNKDMVQTKTLTKGADNGPPRKLIGPEYEETNADRGTYSDREVVHLYTIWDRREQSVMTLSKNVLEPHLPPKDWPYFSEGFPFIPLQFNVVPDTPEDASPYGFSDIEPITPQVIEKSNIRSSAVDHRRRSNLVVFVQEGSTTADALNKMQTNLPLAIVPVPNIQAIQLSPAISLPPAFAETEGMINSDLDRESGLSLILMDSKRAASFDRASVATMAQGNANLKTSYKVDRLEAFFKRVAHYRIGLYWQYMTRIQVGELTGDIPDEESWPSLPTNPVLARERVRRVLELKIQPGSTRPLQDDVLDREQFLRATAIFQSTAPELFGKVKRDWMATLAKKFRDPVLERLIKEATDSTEEEIANQENSLLVQGHPQVVQGDDQSHLAIHAAMAQRPEVKQQMDQHAQMGRSHPLNDHLMGHAQSFKSKQGGGKKKSKTQKGVQQSSQAPSGPETARMGTPNFAGVQGQSMNLRAGAGPTKVGSL